MFFEHQTENKKDDYIKLLSAFGGLSKLFSESTTPYLYYRAHENIFCLTLDASNESRGDVSVDAVLGNTGIGLKTYRYKKSQFEKVAEFNKLLETYRGLGGVELAHVIASARNERITTTKRIYDLERLVYHCVARVNGKFMIHEETMDLIDLDAIVIDSEDGKTLKFHDKKNQYSFNFGKSTLSKKFTSDAVAEFDVDIIEDPFSLLLGGSLETKSTESALTGTLESQAVEDDREYVVLPLYSDRGDAHVQESSGLNQWNASGRLRNPNEAYIPIPAWIHRVYKDFFPPRDVPFRLTLPGGKVIDAKVCQDNSKALMSNPNSDLGEWLLRKVLNLQPRELLTYEKLVNIGIDSVLLTKNTDDSFEIDFKKIGAFEEFKITSLQLDSETDK